MTAYFMLKDVLNEVLQWRPVLLPHTVKYFFKNPLPFFLSPSLYPSLLSLPFIFFSSLPYPPLPFLFFSNLFPSFPISFLSYSLPDISSSGLNFRLDLSGMQKKFVVSQSVIFNFQSLC